MKRFTPSISIRWLTLAAIACVALPNLSTAAMPTIRSQAQVRRLDVLIVLYTRSFSAALTREQVERAHEEVLEFVDFYRTAVGDAVDFHVSFLEVDRELSLSEVSEVAPGRYYLAREDVERELTALGMPDYDFDEVITLYAWNNANPEGAALAYGGGAVGPDGNFLGDAGYNSIGVFAWDPGRISQIMIHEVLHNIDDMFSMSGMPDAFLNADEMSRNMSALLAEQPGAFLPHYADDEMLSYAQRELANRATYPWSMQLVYYAWMLRRTPQAAWLELEYGRVVEPVAKGGARPVYDRLFLSRANDQVYITALSGGAAEAEAVVTGGGRGGLKRRTYRHTDFDGSALFQGNYLAGWVALPDGVPSVEVAVGEGEAEIVRLGMGAIAAPARVVTYETRSGAGEPGAAEAVLAVELREARLDGVGPRVAGAALAGRSPGAVLSFEEREPGYYVAPLERLNLGVTRVDLQAEAEGLVFSPRVVELERRHPWTITTDSQLVTGLGTPFDLTLRIAEDRGVAGARVTASMAGRQLELIELQDGRYSVVLDEGLRPGLDTIHVRAVLAGREAAGVLEQAIPVYVEPRGWIEVPPRIAARPAEAVTLEARVRDRMGRVVKGAGLALGVVVGSELLMMEERVDGSGTYEARLVVPPGEHRIYVIGLVGRYERRVIAVQAQ
jgi:hypothetical protein